MTRAQKIRANERMRMKYEKMFVGQIDRAIRSQISSFTDNLNSRGLDFAQSQLSTALMNEQIGRVVLSLYVAAGIAKAKQVYQQVSREPNQKGFGFNEEWTNKIKDYFSRFLMDKVVARISNTTRQLISSKINQMISEGQSIEWLAQSVESRDFTAWRARMIARTESNRAINYGAQVGAEGSGFQTMKEWVAVHDERTRHSHYLLDGKKVRLDEEFADGLAYPGDPNGDPAETINCRCHVEYTAERSPQGYLIPTGAPPVRRMRSRRRLQNILELVQSN